VEVVARLGGIPVAVNIEGKKFRKRGRLGVRDDGASIGGGGRLREGRLLKRTTGKRGPACEKQGPMRNPRRTKTLKWKRAAREVRGRATGVMPPGIYTNVSNHPKKGTRGTPKESARGNFFVVDSCREIRGINRGEKVLSLTFLQRGAASNLGSAKKTTGH